MDWKKCLLMAGGAAGAAALVYYLLKEEAELKTLPDDAKGHREDRKGRVEAMSRPEVMKILASWHASVQKMKAHMKDIRELLGKQKCSLDEVYQRVKTVEPQDILEEYQLSEAEFDRMLSRFQDDAEVKAIIASIVSGDRSKSVAAKESQIACRKVIDVHAYMLQELDSLVLTFDGLKKLAPKDHYDAKSMSMAVQAMTGAKVEEKFSVTPEAVERGVLAHHTSLATDKEFCNICQEIQIRMDRLLGKA